MDLSILCFFLSQWQISELLNFFLKSLSLKQNSLKTWEAEEHIVLTTLEKEARQGRVLDPT